MARYKTLSGVYDESIAASGKLRPHWTGLIRSLEQLGPEEFAARWDNGRRVIREHGVTYNVYGDPQGMDRPWELDMVPLMIPPDEWSHISKGLSQRARLLNEILSDLYGAQRLLRKGLLPASLVFANPAFLRPCHGIRPAGNIFLHLHAADLARAPDGRWWVLADRTQAPSGAGYALENRIVLSRILPDEFRDLQVQRLASFFGVARDTLRSLAPGGRDNPHVVLLTPGPHNETYFEHAYLARYLGLTLVEGGDLTVRDRRVFLKTLEGLQPVDVILRRVDDTFCDPLELRNDSFLGVPGLVESVRAGQVTVANALGSGLIESPAFLAFLPGLCRRLLGEELILPSVATWWCGQAKEHHHVLEHLDRVVVKPAYGSVSRLPFFGERLSASERHRLVSAIAAKPYNYVGQERVGLSAAPAWGAGGLEPRRVVVRAYVTAGEDGYVVMPGGLTRVSTSGEDPVVSMQSGGGSKDTWVLAEGPVAPVSLLTASGQPSGGLRISTELPSRVADNLFWLGRYAERLEGRLRMLRCVIVRMAGEAGAEGAAELSALLQVLSALGLAPDKPFVPARGAGPKAQDDILQLVYNAQRTGSARELVLRIRHIASIVRDRFSADTWRILNQLQTDSRTRPGRIPMANALALINTLIIDLGAFSGMEMENMTRGHGWRFLDLGRRLERALNLVEWIDAAVSSRSTLPAMLQPLLEMADSALTYRRRYFSEPRLAQVLELLLFDTGNPRSLSFQLNALQQHSVSLPRDSAQSRFGPERVHITCMIETIASVDLTGFESSVSAEGLGELSEKLGRCVSELCGLSDSLSHHYFSLTVARAS